MGNLKLDILEVYELNLQELKENEGGHRQGAVAYLSKHGEDVLDFVGGFVEGFFDGFFN